MVTLEMLKQIDLFISFLYIFLKETRISRTSKHENIKLRLFINNYQLKNLDQLSQLE